MRLKWVGNAAISTVATTGKPAVTSIFANSIHNVDKTGSVFTDHQQPYFHDQFSVLYKRYLVHKCHYKITFMDSTYNWMVATYKTTDANSSFNPASEYMVVNAEKRGIKFSQMSLRAGKKVLSGVVNIPKVLGINSMMYAEADYGSDFGASPAHEVYLTLIAQEVGKTPSVPIRVIVELIFDVELVNPITVAAS